jgi:hypothetical protein
MFGRVQGFATLPGATEYMMVARGVFKETNKMRRQPMEPEARPANAAGGGAGGAGGGAGGGGGGGRNNAPLTDSQKEAIRGALNTYLKPYLRA